MANNNPRGVLLVGSIPLADTKEVLNTTAEILGAYVRRIPDGETGERTNWIHWQYPKLRQHPDLEPNPDSRVLDVPSSKDGQATTLEVRPLRIRPGVDPNTIRFSAGYAEHAITSYATFANMKRDGLIPTDVRFQVSIPTPFAIMTAYIARQAQLEFLPVIERSLIAEVEQIANAIPHQELAIQWDVCLEVIAWEGVYKIATDEPKALILSMLGRLGNAVPADVELGFHLCYGDPGHRHIVEPKDTTVMTEIANGIAREVQRPIQWLHLPVPKDRADLAYFEPLRKLSLPAETELYLGLVHNTDGIDGARARIEAASTVVPTFGVATECGFGRRPPDTVRPLLQLHAECCQPIR